jgi:hypothetical protein
MSVRNYTAISMMKAKRHSGGAHKNKKDKRKKQKDKEFFDKEENY